MTNLPQPETDPLTIASMASFGLLMEETEVQALADAYLSLVAERDGLREALRDARPYVLNVLSENRGNWRFDTAHLILEGIDAALAAQEAER